MKDNDFEIRIQKTLINFHKKNCFTYISLMMLCLSVIVLNIIVIYLDVQKFLNGFSAGICCFNFIFLFQQYIFSKNDYNFEMQKLHHSEIYNIEN